MIAQFGVLPYRNDPEKGLQILLVTSRDTGRWVIPRGNRVPGLQGDETALHEAYEEAGVEGEISAAPIGRFSYEKKRAGQEPIPAKVTVYALNVTRRHRAWPERRERTSRWFTPSQAALAVDEPDLRALILAFDPAALGGSG